MICEVLIPPPSSKRMMKETKTLIVTHGNNWDGFKIDKYTIDPNIYLVQFEVPDGYLYKWNTKIIDGNEFNVEVEYRNSTGTKKEKIQLVPAIIK